MKTPIILYIGTYEVEFNTPPEILYSYKVTELNNPTIVKNSFSKTITIEGTPANNKIFGQYWNLNRMQANGEYAAGIYFNASKKVPFKLYIGSEIAESGYVKLDEIKKAGNSVTYEITLYGGLGEFFYTLTYDEDGNKLSLADLEYFSNGKGESELDFVINQQTIRDAWDPAHGGNPLWECINFAPCYNGIPDSLDADKVIIPDGNCSAGFIHDSGNYTFSGGYSIGTLPDKFSEWEVRDLRSYLQRPVINVEWVLDAIFKYAEKKGFDVDLDGEFFNGMQNIFYGNTWMTLPLLTELEYESKSGVNGSLEVGDLTGTYADCYFDIYPEDLRWTSMQSAKFTGKLKVNTSNTTATTLYTSWERQGNFWHNARYYNGAVWIQAVAYNDSNGVVGASPIYRAGNGIELVGGGIMGWQQVYDPTTGQWHKEEYYGDSSVEIHLVPENLSQMYKGQGGAKEEAEMATFKGGRGSYYLTKSNGTQHFEFNINTNGLDISKIRVFVFWGANKRKTEEVGRTMLFTKEKSEWRQGDTIPKVSITNLGFEIVNSTAVYSTGDKLTSGCLVTKRDLLKTDYTPADFLLSYCKLFGLFFTKDTDKNTIHIQSRGNFYDLEGDTINLEERLDRSKDFQITPITFDSKWYDLSLEVREGEFAKDYDSANPAKFGTQRINTGYNLGAETKNLYEKSIFKTAVSCVEDSKYFVGYPAVGLHLEGHPLGYEYLCGLKYNLYYSGSTMEKQIATIPKAYITSNHSIYGSNYDVFAKPQFHDKSGKGIDGSSVLLFRNYDSTTSNYFYWITDDLPAMRTLNGNSTWIYTQEEMHNSTRIATKIGVSGIPVYNRYNIYNSSAFPSAGSAITYNLDFGQTRMLYMPKVLNNDKSTLYYYFWKNYLTDLYDVNNRILTCYCRLDGKPNPDWLKRFYWFDNSIWRINEITDWNVSSYDTIKMQFVKVLDKGAYENTFNYQFPIRLRPEYPTIGSEGGWMRIYIDTMVEEEWVLEYDGDYGYAEQGSGVGSGFFIFYFEPNNNEEREITIQAYLGSYRNPGSCTILQRGQTLSVAQLTGTIPASGGTAQFRVTSDYPWSANTFSGWISPSSITGNTGTSIHNFSVEENINTSSRVGQITFNNGSNSIIRSVVQMPFAPTGVTIILDSTTASPTGETITGRVLAAERWAINTLPEWMEISPMSGMYGESNITIAVAPNSGTTARTGSFVGIGQTSGVIGISPAITQSPIPRMTISPTAITASFASAAYSASTTLIGITPSDVLIKQVPSWVLSCSIISASTGYKVQLTTSQNTSTTSRAAAIYFMDANDPGGDTLATLVIAQRGKPSMTLDHYAWTSGSMAWHQDVSVQLTGVTLSEIEIVKVGVSGGTGWLSGEFWNNMFCWNISENFTHNARKAYFSFRYQGVELARFTIHQLG